MTDRLAEAEAMFVAIAERRGVAITRVDNPHVDLEIRIDGDEGLAVLPVTLGLQNSDELTFGVGEFWASFFPFDAVKGLFEKAVEGWFTGQTRFVYFWRGGRLVRIDMQVRLKDGSWQKVYRQYCTVILPFWTTRHAEIYRSAGLQATAS